MPIVIRALNLSRNPHHGQALVEFILVAPLIILILVAGAMVGLAMYQGNLTSEAIKEPSMHKIEMAGTSGSVSNGTLMGYTKQGAKGLIPSSGSPLDNLKTVNINDRVTVLAGSKNYRPPMGNLLPNLNFTFSVSNAIQRNLLRPVNMGGAVARSANDIQSSPAGSRTPPWEIPGFIPAFGGCAPSGPTMVSSIGARQITGASNTYISAVSWAKTTDLDLGIVYDLAQQYAGECASKGGACAAENQRLQPKPEPGRYRNCSSAVCETSFNNPPGAPGMRITIMVQIVSAEVEETITTNPDGTTTTSSEVTTPGSTKPPQVTSSPVDGFGPNHGMYFDPSGAYIKPPGDFVDSCKRIKQGECALEKAVARSNELAAKLQDECQL